MATDQDLLSQVQRALLETADGGVTASTPLWTPSEWRASLSHRQRRFLEESGLVAVRTTAPASAGVSTIELPATLAFVLRAAWHGADGAITPLDVIGPSEADMALSWPVGRTRPKYVVSTLLPMRQLHLLPAPVDAGVVELIGVATSADVSGSGDTLTVPEDWQEYLRYGVLADALFKAGPAQDLSRGAYAQARVEEGVALSRLLLDELAGGLTAGQGGFGGVG